MRFSGRLRMWLRRSVAAVLLRSARQDLPDDPVRARKYALRTFELYRITGDAEPIAAAADLVAQASYYIGDYRTARRFGAVAYRFYRRHDDRNATCLILAVLSGVSLRLGREASALEYAQRSHALAQEIGAPELIAMALGNLGQALPAWGRYEEAVRYAKEAILLMEAHHLTDNRNYVLAHNVLGTLYTHLNQDALAIDHFERALGIASAARDTRMQSMLKSNLGLLRWRYRNWEDGLPKMLEALGLAQRSGDLLKEGEISLDIARTLIELGQLDDAMTLLERAFMVARHSGNRELEWLVVNAESRLLERRNRFEESASAAERALSIAMEIGSDAHRMVAMHILARSCMLLQQYERAAELLEQVVHMEDAVRHAMNESALLISMFDVQVSVYEDLQWVQVKLGRYTDALVSAERGHARVLAQQIAERDDENESPPDFDEIRRIATELNAMFLVVSLIRDPAYQFDREPEGYAFVWAVPPDPAKPVAFHQSPSLRDAAQQAEQDPSFGGELGLGVSEAERRMMYDWFIAPIADALPADPRTVVTFVPTGPLAVRPMAAACDASGVSFIERHPVAMTPSIQTLRLAMRRESRGEGALVVGDPEGDLDSAQKEAVSIANRLAGQMPVSMLADSDATRDAVAQSIPGKRLLHFASHAKFDENDETSGHGMLSLRDGDLTAAEIRAIPLDAELVVLSACDTGQGRIAADSVLGLARSFILAGARSVIATVWEMPDGPSSLLIEHFYTRMSEHRNKALALQEAMQHVKAIPGYEDPYLWAGFVLIGHPH